MHTIPEVLSFFQKRKLQFLLLQKRLRTEFWLTLWSYSMHFCQDHEEEETDRVEQNSVVKLLEPAWLFHALQVSSDTKCNFWMEGLWSSEVLWFVHQTLPWFQLMLYLAPTEQWCCSMRSNCHCRNKCIQFLRFCHFSKAHVAISAASEEAAHRILADSVISFNAFLSGSWRVGDRQFQRLCHFLSQVQVASCAASEQSAHKDSSFGWLWARLSCVQA